MLTVTDILRLAAALAHGVGTDVLTGFLTLLAGIVANKRAIKMHLFDDPRMKLLQSAQDDRGKMIHYLQQRCLGHESRAYAQCDADIIRTVVRRGWVVKRLERQGNGEVGEDQPPIRRLLQSVGALSSAFLPIHITDNQFNKVTTPDRRPTPPVSRRKPTATFSQTTPHDTTTPRRTMEDHRVRVKAV